MKMKTKHLSLMVLLSFIIILIIYLLYVNKIPSQNREGFISRFYRPYYRILKRGISGYFNYFLNY